MEPVEPVKSGELVVFADSIRGGDVTVEVVRLESGLFSVWGEVVVDELDLGGIRGTVGVEGEVGQFASEGDAKTAAHLFLAGGWRDWEGEGL